MPGQSLERAGLSLNDWEVRAALLRRYRFHMEKASRLAHVLEPKGFLLKEAALLGVRRSNDLLDLGF